MAERDAEIQIKGTPFLSVLSALQHWKGVEAANRVRQALPGEVGNAVRLGTLLVAGWYPVAWYRALYETILAQVGGGDETVRHLGRTSTELDAKGIYRLVFKILSPQAVFSQSAKLVNQYFSGVTLQVEELRDGHARARYVGFRGFNRVLWLELMASGERVMELAGAKALKSRVLKGGGDQDAELDLDITWQ